MTQHEAEFTIDTLVRTHADMVYRLALLHMKRQCDAEDVFQEVFLRLVKHRNKLQSEEHIKAWLIRVTINCCKTQLSGSWRKRVVPTDQSILEETLEAGLNLNDSSGEIRNVVEALPEKYRTVIHLFYFEDLSILQIAETLQMKEGTIKAQLSRGRALIRKKIEGGLSSE